MTPAFYASIPEKCTVVDAARIIDVSPETLREMCKNKAITHRIVGAKKIVIMREDIIDYFESRICQRKAAAPILNGEKTARHGRSSPMPTEKGRATQRALMTVEKLKKSSRHTSSNVIALPLRA